MTTSYIWLKFAHVSAVILWLGGAVAMALLAGRVAATAERASLASFLRAATYFGPRVSGGGSVLALLTGIGMVLVGHIGFKTLWVSLALAGIVIHFIVGGVFIGRSAEALERLASAPETTDAQIKAAQGRFSTLTGVYVTIMFLVVLDMVVKPTL